MTQDTTEAAERGIFKNKSLVINVIAFLDKLVLGLLRLTCHTVGSKKIVLELMVVAYGKQSKLS